MNGLERDTVPDEIAQVVGGHDPSRFVNRQEQFVQPEAVTRQRDVAIGSRRGAGEAALKPGAKVHVPGDRFARGVIPVAGPAETADVQQGIEHGSLWRISFRTSAKTGNPAAIACDRAVSESRKYPGS
jgi:hypothetical protein